MQPKISHSESFYMRAPGYSETESNGVVIPDGVTVGVYRFRANGADPSAYVMLIWDHEGESETIFGSTKGDIDIMLDPTIETYQMTGDGVKKLVILITNDNATMTPYIGGAFELIQV